MAPVIELLLLKNIKDLKMKNVLFVLFVMSIVFASCTKESIQITAAVLANSDIENHELFDANCTPGDVVLDSFYLNETTIGMMPDYNRLVFKSESRETINLYKKDEEPDYRREVVEQFCVNADEEWSVGSEVTEHLRIVYEGTMSSGDEVSITGFMHKEKTWFTDKTKETGYYDDLQIRVNIVAPNSVTYHQSAVRCVTWFDDSVVSIEDTDLRYVDEKLTTVTLNGQEFEDVIIGNDDPHSSEVKIYTQKDVGVIGFISTTGELFVIQ